MHPVPVFAIVGAGFSGIAVAVQLLRQLRLPARVCLINRNHRFGRGLAYGTRSASHLLNVPAGRMSLSPEDDDEFVRFLQQQGLAYRSSDFVPRKLYGEYLESTLEHAQAQAAPGVSLEMLQAEVGSLDLLPGVAKLRFGDGRVLEATEVVLALGNFAPRPPCGDAAAWSSPRVINDPWGAAALAGVPKDASVLLAGTGLTAYDVVLTLLDWGHTGEITMMSRRGLLPQPHREQERAPASGMLPEDVLADARTARAQLQQIRALMRQAQDDGHDWRDVIGGLRSHTPRLWQQLDLRGQRQFLRHLLPYWDTHRHRAAPAIGERIRQATANGQLRAVAGRLLGINASDAGEVRVRWRSRGEAEGRVDRFDALVNCTGPSADLRHSGNGLVAQLLARNALKPDPLRLGLEVDGEYRALRNDATALSRLRYIGPLLKAQLWEATAVPELRVHAQRLAAVLSVAPAD